MAQTRTVSGEGERESEEVDEEVEEEVEEEVDAAIYISCPGAT